MAHYADSINHYAQFLKRDFRQLDDSENQRVRRQFEEKFVPLYIEDPLDWSYTAHFYAEDTEEAVFAQRSWRWLKNFMPNEAAYLLMNPSEDKTIFEFTDSRDLIDHIFTWYTPNEFYITNQTMSYLVATDHSTVTYAIGEAGAWLKDKRMKFWETANLPHKPMTAHNFQLNFLNDTLLIECWYDEDERKPIRIAFDAPRIEEWRTNQFTITPHLVENIYLLQIGRDEFAGIRGARFGLDFTYRHLEVEKM